MGARPPAGLAKEGRDRGQSSGRAGQHVRQCVAAADASARGHATIWHIRLPRSGAPSTDSSSATSLASTSGWADTAAQAAQWQGEAPGTLPHRVTPVKCIPLFPHPPAPHRKPSLSISRSRGMGVMNTSPRIRPNAFTAHSRRSWSEAEGGAPPLTSLSGAAGQGQGSAGAVWQVWQLPQHRVQLACVPGAPGAGQPNTPPAQHLAMASTSPKP